MTRVFTIAFSYEGVTYDAEITVNDTADPHTISVYVHDKKLHALLPEGKAVVSVEDQQKPVPKEASAVERLKSQIVAAFKAHENQMPPVSMW